MATQKRYLYLCIIVLFIAACNNGNEAQQPSSNNKPDQATAALTEVWDSVKVNEAVPDKGILSFRELSRVRQQFIERLIARQANCTGSSSGDCSDPDGDGKPTDCSSNYCGITECAAKIICCHTIDSLEFDTLTAGQKGLATFSTGEVRNIVDAADCKRQYIRLLYDNGYYKLGRVNDTTSGTGQNKSYYSVALFQGIVARKITSIVLYKGISIDSLKRKIVPFKVNFETGPPAYYDVSNDLP